MQIKNIRPFEKDLIQVVIETPRGSRYKYDYDLDLDLFRLDKVLPFGMVFPFDFGFIPGTKGEDGDPLDVLVIADEPISQGVLVSCRLIGTLEASQTERDGHSVRNDRIVAIPDCSVLYRNVGRLEELDKNLAAAIEQFFIHYNQQAGKKFTPIRWADEISSKKLIRQHSPSDH